MSDTPNLRWGFVGASDIAATRIIPTVRSLGHRIVSLSSRTLDHAHDFAARYDINHVAASVDDLVSRNDIDAVYISSTNDRHLDQVLAAAQAGKHVLCEKPLAVTVSDAKTMVAACQAAGVVLAVNHHLPAMGTHRRIRELVSNGAVGRPLSVAVRHTGLLPERLAGWRLGAGPGAGVVLDIATHDASAVNAILGRVALETSAITVNQGNRLSLTADTSVAVARYEGDVVAHFHDSYSTPFAESLLEVHGTLGSIRAPRIMNADPIGEVILIDEKGETTIDVADRRSAYEYTLDRFTLAVAGGGLPVVDGAGGVRALSLAIAISEAALSGRRINVEE
ncbi:Gfo/Idh/MocA family protein [Paenarthrobacter sp. NPDC092416]|uniref:Gfo/Idh/MocA family protein n=1 Tax=Paenarthrobacter sp. NPDC092416 TaxID=3364386 RepID=UPI0037F938AF